MTGGRDGELFRSIEFRTSHHPKLFKFVSALTIANIFCTFDLPVENQQRCEAGGWELNASARAPSSVVDARSDCLAVGDDRAQYLSALCIWGVGSVVAIAQEAERG